VNGKGVQTRPTVVLIDDHELFRQGLRALLEGDFKVVAVEGTSAKAIRLSQRMHPDLLLLDVELNDAPAEQTVRTIRRVAPTVVIVILTMFGDAILKRQLLAAGASDFVSKTVGPQELTTRLREALSSGPADTEVIEVAIAGPLSRRELEVLRLIAAAASNRDIALELSISESTVKRHTANMYLKLAATSRLDAVIKAKRLGLIR
jgi:DNA-binding NarL/FixJ family response regulator